MLVSNKHDQIYKKEWIFTKFKVVNKLNSADTKYDPYDYHKHFHSETV
jgi:hypothetical protein